MLRNTWMRNVALLVLVGVLVLMSGDMGVEAAVIGVDLGNQFFKSTLVKPGYPFTIVENTQSQRKTPTAITFTPEHRAYGLDSIAQSTANPVNTFTYIRDMIGMEYNDENLETLRKKFYNFNNLVQDDRGYIAFELELKSQGETKTFTFTVEEMLAMVLSHARELAEIQSKGSVKNVYMTVPSHFSMNQRRMLSDAAEMAGLSSLGMTEENVAASITYGVDRKDENETHSVLFLNLGSSDFEATVAKYYARAENVTDRFGNTKLGEVVENIEILSHGFSTEVSGRLFDLELVDLIAERFNSLEVRKGKEDIREKPRIVNRLLKEAPKIKETLSANKEKIVNLPEVADYINLKTTIKRYDFEERIDKYMKYIGQAIKDALEKAQITVAELSSVEIIGGALRVPKVKDYMASIVGEELLGSHINGDESMSFGAAFIGANSSSSFVARKIFLHPLVEENIYLNITSLNLEESDPNYVNKRYLFFNGTDNGRKKYGVHTLDDLKAEFYTESQGVLHKVIINGVPEILESDEYKNNGTTPKVVFESSFSMNGFIEVHKVSAKVMETYIDEIKRRVPITNSTESEESESKTEEEQVTEETAQSEDSESTTESTSTDEEVKKPAPEIQYETITEQVEKNRTHTKKVTFEEEFIGHRPMTTEQKINSIAHLADFDKRDKLIFTTMQAKNDYEALIYSSRDWISGEENQVYSTPEIIEEFMKNLTESEDWLYEEGYDEKFETYQERIDGLNKTIAGMKYRQQEHNFRNEWLNSTSTLVKNFTNEIDEFAKFHPWFESDKIETLKEYARNASEWYNEAFAKQETTPLHEDPILTTGDIRDRIMSIGYLMEKMSKAPKPKEWVEKEKEKIRLATVTDEEPEIVDQEFKNITNADATSEDAAPTDENKPDDIDSLGEASSETEDQESKEDL